MIVYPPSERFMASHSPQAAQPAPAIARHAATRLSSFPQPAPRDENEHDGLKPPKRAHTFHNGSPAERHRDRPDAFDTSQAADHDDAVDVTRGSVELDDLPIELITLTDSFIESLGARVHATPPTIDKLSQLFQDFYATASAHIATHVGALATRQRRDSPAAPSTPSISSAASRLRSKATSLTSKDRSKADSEQQMITADELADRKRARKALEGKRGLLEEAVERRLCEGIYDRIYRHRSTHDEAQDDKLRSKTAALALVGIGPADLGVDTGHAPPQTPGDASNDVQQWLHQARTDLTRMSESRYPLGKLNHLKAAHKSIVDTLAHFHPSASADEVMPMLIYTLITLPPEKLHIMSDLHFMQHFRWEPKLTGEAAYCLTNLEAAISFLQTVDLATLRADEHPSGPLKSTAQPGTPKADTFPPAYPQGPSKPAGEADAGSAATGPRPAPSPSVLKAPDVLRTRRLSDLVNTPAQALGAASDVVFSTADQGLKTISNSLGDSYGFLLGKLRERQQGPKESIAVPRTLDDARKLVSTPPPDDDDNASGSSSAVGAEDAEQLRPPSLREERVLSMIGGRRDASVDSARSGRSGSSSKKVLFAEEPKTSTSFLSPGQSPAVLEQMRSLGNTLNPMARLSSMSMMRGFGRNVNVSTPTTAVAKASDGGDVASALPDSAAAPPPRDAPRLAPPNKRFLEMQNPGDLRIGEVLDLLRDYRRLAAALKDLDAFADK